MAKQKKAPSKETVALEAAKKALDTAKANHEKQETETNAKALAGAKAKYAEANDAVKRERFLRVTVGRATNVLSSMDNLAKAFSASSYKYSEAEAKEIVAAIEKKIGVTSDAIDRALSNTTEAKTEGPAFSFLK